MAMRTGLRGILMDPSRQQGATQVPAGLARALRHEIGDYLQRVYSTVAVLQSRLPADAQQERDLLARLKSGAEECRRIIDAIHDFFSVETLSAQPVDLAETARKLAAALVEQHPHLAIRLEESGRAVACADPRRLYQVGLCLLTNACQAARRQILFRTHFDPALNEVEWSISDDGPGVPPDYLDRLFTPFSSTRPGHLGLGLALAQKLVHWHGGRIQGENLPEGGFRVRVRIPVDLIR